jgi:rubredoxin
MNSNLPPGTSLKDIHQPDKCARCGDECEDMVIIDNGEGLVDSVLCPDCALELD